MYQKIKKIYHFLIAFFSNIFYFFPSKKIKVIGITGTKGKSTIASLLEHTLSFYGYKTALLSSVYRKVCNDVKLNDTENTMPGRGYIQKFLYDAVKNKCKFAIIEVTSQGVIQFRHKFIKWDFAIFNGIHPEHIESHGSFENYLNAKLSFFKYVSKKSNKSVFFVNSEDKYSKYFTESVDNNIVFTFSKLDILKNRIIVPKTLQGEFNLINISAVVSILKYLNIPIEVIRNAIGSFNGIPGRMEFVQYNPYSVVIDYAHTPEALEGVLSYLSRNKSNKKNSLICVFGSAGGGRDKWKRPVLGNIASKYCDIVILTNEDPYDEDEYKIINDIRSGFAKNNKARIFEIIDRKKAIEKALSIAKNGDIVCITGKGSEKNIHTKNGKKIPWSDLNVVNELLKNTR